MRSALASKAVIMAIGTAALALLIVNGWKFASTQQAEVHRPNPAFDERSFDQRSRVNGHTPSPGPVLLPELRESRVTAAPAALPLISAELDAKGELAVVRSRGRAPVYPDETRTEKPYTELSEDRIFTGFGSFNDEAQAEAQSLFDDLQADFANSAFRKKQSDSRPD